MYTVHDTCHPPSAPSLLHGPPILLSHNMQEEAPNEDERRKGKIVIYMTSLTAVRDTYSQCCTLLEIVHNHNVRYQTKDIYLHPKYKKELKERLQSRMVTVPQVSEVLVL